MKPKIYINARFLTQPITGVQRYAHELVKALDQLIERGEIDLSLYQLEMLAPRKGIRHKLELKHIPLRQVGSLTGHAWEQLELPFFCKDGLLFCPGNTAPLRSLYTRQPVVVTVHSLSYLYFPMAYSKAFKAVYNFLIPQILRRSKAVLTVSQSERDLILRQYPEAVNRLKVIQNGGLSGKFLGRLDSIKGPLPDKPFVLFVGSLSSGKNIKGVLEALSAVNEKGDLDLVIAGASSKTFEDTKLVIPETLAGKIHLLGQIDETEVLFGLYKTASALVFPSFYESSGIPPIEAMACGCPVIASDIPALKERCGDAALYCNPQDPEDIADKILQITENSQLRETLRQKGMARSKDFTWEQCARDTFTIIKEVLSCIG